jgi:hypothetical protein
MFTGRRRLRNYLNSAKAFNVPENINIPFSDWWPRVFPRRSARRQKPTSFPFLLFGGMTPGNAIVSLFNRTEECRSTSIAPCLSQGRLFVRAIGRIVRLKGSQHPEWARECILERIRQTEFSHLPSRFDCVFLFGSFIEAEFYKASLGANALLVM